MKRTEIEKKERELKRVEKKKQKNIGRPSGETETIDFTVSNAINSLSDLFQYDDQEIYNISHHERIHELMLQIQESFNDKQIDTVIRKAIKRTKIEQKQKAYNELRQLFV